ncbi:MAG: hypothetical protein F4Y60_06620 [Boseongicola sp. SB0664_bin_43]|uniref:Uncharacterized protein n=1 Tax=Boseongicola sp. SB0664_bin_43 TaxID=2604844 RepID=A0A6B0XYH1_9RHOB|nr:hypothetical protein [Boseongicola sp. SB0664_bin_43]MYK32533.1 hypothetical protein [Boseongicola sp. SB0670_bin_30]
MPAGGIGVPLINFLAGTVERRDVSFAAAGEGLTVQRQSSDRSHSHPPIGKTATKHAIFESFNVMLAAPLGPRPLHPHQGAEFIHVT